MLWEDVLEVDWLGQRFYFTCAGSSAALWLVDGQFRELDLAATTLAEEALQGWAEASPWEARQLFAALALDAGGPAPHATEDSRVPAYLIQALRLGTLLGMAPAFPPPAEDTLEPLATGRVLHPLQFQVQERYPGFESSRPQREDAFATNRPQKRDAFSTNRPQKVPRPPPPPAPPPTDPFATNRPVGDEKIVRVELLEGDQAAAGDVRQFVNLKRTQTWVDGERIPHADRTGALLRFRVAFDRPGSFSFRVKLEPHPNNIRYSDAETSRNAWFTWTDEERSYATEGDGTKIVEDEFRVTVAGNDRFRLVATDGNGQEVRSAWIRNKRLIYFVRLTMDRLHEIASNIDPFIMEFRRYGVELAELPSVTIPHVPAIDQGTGEAKFRSDKDKAWASSQGPNKAPYALAIAFVDQLPRMLRNVRIASANVRVGPGEPEVLVAVELHDGRPRPLWHDLGSEEDWFVDGYFDVAGGPRIQVDRADCQPLPESAGRPSSCWSVTVNVHGLPTAVGTLTLNVNCVDGFAGGISYHSDNLICIATRTFWKPRPAADQVPVLMHELGHSCHLVPDGTGTLPDRPPKHYTHHGHIGPHCHEGLELPEGTFEAVRGACVMFGSVNSVDYFCKACGTSLKKVDLSQGW